MFFQTSLRKVALATAACVTGLAMSAEARAPQSAIDSWKERKALLKTAAGCTAPENAIDLDINNVRARIMTAGNQWYDPSSGEARYEIPKGSRKNSLYAGALWVGGYDTQGQLKVTAQMYRSNGQNDYWTGPLNENNTIDQPTCALWDRFWKINKVDVLKFRELYRQNKDNLNDFEASVTDPAFDVIKEWPAQGNVDAKGVNDNPLSFIPGRNYAPFIDVDGNGKYEWRMGDYPGEPKTGEIRGDQFIWRVYNDMGNTKTQTGTLGIGLEVQASAFAYTTKDYLNDASFYNYRLINRGNLTLDSCYTATWTDADLGFYNDDYIGSDTARGLGILYNATGVDGTGGVNHYGNQVPMVGVDFFIGPTKFTKSIYTGADTSYQLKMSNFTYFTGNGAACITDPNTGIEFYRYMTGSNKCGDPFTNDFTGVKGVATRGFGSGPKTTTVFSGDPNQPGTWSECFSNNVPGDRRFVHSAGPFRLTGGGVTNDITIGVCWVANVGGCPNTNFSKIRLADDAIQALFDNDFRTIEGPEAPRVTYRELNEKVILYFTNDSTSNNFQEKFGYDKSESRYRISTKKMRELGGADSLYKFEGYRVFQLKNSEVKPSQIFGENGEIDLSVAREVFQTDIRNGVGQITNYALRAEINSGTPSFRPEIKVEGRDSGIAHSCIITQDAFATGANKTLVNYKSYYFVTIAYAYNSFKSFDPNNLQGTQDVAYLESGKGQNGTPIKVDTVMPNPSNGNMGTVLNSDYGTGVDIRRIVGTGNGGNVLQMNRVSEDSALLGATYQVSQPVYTAGSGPVTVKVIDPVKLVEADWTLSITGASYTTSTYRGIIPDSGRWALTMNDGSTPVTIYGERSIKVTNEQILAKYGLAVTVQQVAAPGDDPASGNGYLTSDVSFMNPSQTWLSGVPDEEGYSYLNWIRSGSNETDNLADATKAEIRDWASGNQTPFDPTQAYENMLANNSLTRGTWTAYPLVANRDSLNHSMMPPEITGPTTVRLSSLPSVDVVFTSDTSKWSRCIVVETSSDSLLSQGRASKFFLRRHAGWNKGDFRADGAPEYSAPAGMSWFPGYAINQETGERLNIFFGEDSYLTSDRGNDMLWNPTSTLLSVFGTPVFGGKHYVWVTGTKYDGCQAIYDQLKTGTTASRREVYRTPVWCGMPMTRDAAPMLKLTEGYIPTETRLRFRVSRPYARYVIPGKDSVNRGYPLYSFTTKGLGAKSLEDASNTSDKQNLLDQIGVVPNPYFARSDYERNRLDTRVYIINLPKRAEISIYSTDGSLVRRLAKDDANTAYTIWDLRNTKGLPVASGMYLIHVKADGIGETVLRWFGALRPLDVTSY